MGGASIDATVVRVAGGVYSIESSVESRDLGGDQLNHVFADFIATEFQR
jgi:molecular chaperone DnaK (HSP70)